MRYLVVDDSPTMRRIVINALRTFGIEEIIEAEDGQDALSKLRSDKVDFVITDWNMPNMTGLELTKAIRSDDKLKSLPILMVTTRGLKQDIIEALQARVNNYVVKPFTPQVLKEKIDAVLKAVEPK
jgi:two-component system chemotaxis response regulator CheY